MSLCISFVIVITFVSLCGLFHLMSVDFIIFLADPMVLQFNIEKTIRSNGEAALAALDRKMISQLNDKTSKSEELKGLLSKGLYKLPAKNCISLMTTSGAKGGAVSISRRMHAEYMSSVLWVILLLPTNNFV